MSYQSAWLSAVVLASVPSLLHAQGSAPWRDPSPHTIQFVSVDENVRLEVLDWGGSGRAVVLLAGLGNTAHVFDGFAPKLVNAYHVYGITRRGFGASSIPPTGYDADRLGDDVLAVLDALKLERPLLVGASIAGEELSSIDSRNPGRVSGLVYLEGAYPYAFDNGQGMSMNELFGLMQDQQKIGKPPERRAEDRANFGAFRDWLNRTMGIAYPEAELRQTMDSAPDGTVGRSRTSPKAAQAVFAGVKKYTEIRAPVLAIFVSRSDFPPWVTDGQDVAVRSAMEALWVRGMELGEKQAKAFEDGVPGARVVRIKHANHAVFLSNEADVLREMRDFMGVLK